jgi:LCP family protein required for cell wall assembly
MTISIDLDEKQIKKEPRTIRAILKKDKRSNFTAVTEKHQVKERKFKKVNWKKLLLTSVIILLAGALVYGVYYLYKVSKDIGFKFNPSEIISEEEPELKKDSTGKYTSILILGVDTRDTGGSLNTDTIIVATYMYDTHELTMTSIPRDFYAEVPCIYSDITTYYAGTSYSKINSVYACGGGGKEGFNTLEDTITKVTGIEIQYYVMVNFEAFVEIVDTLGGITINVEESFTDKCYPSEQGIPGSYYLKCIDSWGWWRTISFSNGVQTMDGETALEFARSRHGTYSSGGGVMDYGRAAHQQQVVDAVRTAISNSSTYTNPQKLLGLISAVKDNIRVSEFTIDDIKALLNLLTDFKEHKGETYSFVLDPSAGNSQLITTDPTRPKLGFGNYMDINDYISKVLLNPSFYEEDSSVYVYNTGLGYQETYEKVLDLLERYPYSNIQFMGTFYSDKEGIVVYEHETGTKPSTQKELTEYLKPDSTTQPEYITTNLNGEDISIFFGKEISEESINNE